MKNAEIIPNMMVENKDNGVNFLLALPERKIIENIHINDSLMGMHLLRFLAQKLHIHILHIIKLNKALLPAFQ